jgi:NADP-dependent 3-hydroxy acid dehydrogenase YdfG
VREGAKVAIGDLDLELAEKTASAIGGDTIALELDVTRKDSFASYLSQVEERLGPVDVLINNAGIMPLGRFVDEDDATARRMFDINVHGLMFGMKLVMPSMMRRNSGHIVNIASQAGKGGFPGGATYCATKHAVVGLSEAVHGELIDTDINVSVVMPAAVNTELGSGLVDTRAVKKLEPQEVADAIVDALQYPTFDVWVPKFSNGIYRFMQLVPRRGREAIVRALKADQVLAGADMNVRAAYEDRASRSEPGLEPQDAGAAADAADADKVEAS